MIPTREHWRIQKWAREQGAVPAQVRRLKFDGEPAILTFTFGEVEEARPDIYPVSWEAFFAEFDLLGLSFAFDECGTDFQIVRVAPAKTLPQ